MNTKPSTEQVILEVRRALLDTLGPQLTAPDAQVTVQMLENVLRNAATRAAHELAWMREEAEQIVELADRLLAERPDTPAVADALARYRSEATGGLHYDEAQHDYDLAGRLLSELVEVIVCEGTPEQHAGLRAVLDTRLDHETQIMGEWGFVGRG